MVKWLIFDLNSTEIRRTRPQIGLKMSIFDQKFRYVEKVATQIIFFQLKFWKMTSYSLDDRTTKELMSNILLR